MKVIAKFDTSINPRNVNVSKKYSKHNSNMKNNSLILLTLFLSLFLLGNNAQAQRGSHSKSSSGSHQKSSYKSTSASTHVSTGHHRSTYAVGVARDSHGKIKRSSEARTTFKKQSGYPHGRKGYVIDHKVPLAKGGCDCPSNMQWQTKEDAKKKDKTERK
jgi:hypothetical protein